MPPPPAAHRATSLPPPRAATRTLQLGRGPDPGGRGTTGPGLTCRPTGADRGPGQAARAAEGRLASCNEMPLLDSAAARPPPNSPPASLIRPPAPLRAAPPRLKPQNSPRYARPRRSPSCAPPESGSASAASRGLFRLYFSSGACGGACSSPSPTIPSAAPLRAAPNLPPFRSGGGSANLTSPGGESCAPAASASRGTATRARAPPPLFPAAPHVTRLRGGRAAGCRTARS